MKKWNLSLCCILTLIGLTSAERGSFGLGIILGNPSGISANLIFNNVNAAHLVLGYDVDHNHGRFYDDHDNGYLYLGGDYVWYKYNLIPVSSGSLPLYFGPGLNASFSDNSRVGVRGVIGLEYQFANAPFDIFLELAPGINLMPNTHVYGMGGFGARFYF